jgi:NAD(P) transhydrogenase subunit beta
MTMDAVSPTLINLIIFVLAIYVGYHVVWNVTPALHTPLMAVTNAISAIVIVGAMLAAALTETNFGKLMGTFAVALAAVNVFGGFLVTRRMLEMFKKKERHGRQGGGKQMISMNLVTLLYLVASVCFIQALKGLSHPTTSIRGNRFGMAGMAIAALTTAALIVKLAGQMGAPNPWFGLSYVLVGLLIGGGLGAYMANKVEMTKMPELVAFMHSMIGLAAVCIAVAAVAEPQALIPGWRRAPRSRSATGWSWPGRGHRRHHLQRFGDCVRQAQRQVQVPPVPGRAGAVQGPAHAEPGAGRADARPDRLLHLATGNWYWRLRASMTAIAFVLGVLIIIPIGGADMPVVVSDAQQLLGLGGGGHRLLAEQQHADHCRLAGGQLGRDPERTSCARR